MRRLRRRVHNFIALLAFCAILSPDPANAAGTLAALAQAACLGDRPGEVVTVSRDGHGGTLIWLTDASADLWLCRTDAHGHVTFAVPILSDLLEGTGLGLLPRRSGGSGQPEPAIIAAAACRIYADDETAEILAAVPDGLEGSWLSGYAITLETTANETFLCDATPNAQVWVYRPLEVQGPGI